MTKEALKLALEAFGEIEWSNNSQWQSDRAKVAITAIKEALAQPEQEPVACVEYIPCCTDKTCSKCKAAIKQELVCVCGAVWEGQELIYTTPQRTWVGLTDEELNSVLPYCHNEFDRIEHENQMKGQPYHFELFVSPSQRNQVLDEVAKEFDKMKAFGTTAESFACFVRNMKTFPLP